MRLVAYNRVACGSLQPFLEGRWGLYLDKSVSAHGSMLGKGGASQLAPTRETLWRCGAHRAALADTPKLA